MKKISINIMKILLILIILQTIFTTTCQAGFWSDILEDGKGFLTEGENEIQSEGSPIDQDKMKKEIDNFYNMLLIIGVIVAIIAGAVIGIKFLTGTIVEQAKIKEILIPYVIGCIVIFGAFGIWKLVMTVLGSI